MKTLIMFSLIVSMGCGLNGNQTLTATGTVNTNINIVFQFINQIEELCIMQNPSDTFATVDQYNEAVATCTFSSLSVIQSQVLTSNCSLPNLTTAETQVCSTLGL